MKQVKIGLITSPGGHLFETLCLQPWWHTYDRFWVTDKAVVKDMQVINQEKVYQGYFPENRSLVHFCQNLWLAWKILHRERPEVLFSTGAGIAPPFFIIGKLMGIKLIFMETFIFIAKPTLSGRLVYRLCDLFLVQNYEYLTYYPKAKYWGAVA